LILLEEMRSRGPRVALLLLGNLADRMKESLLSATGERCKQSEE
jgi:hypothetical protein